MAKENRIFVFRIKDGNDCLSFYIYNSTTGNSKGSYLNVGKVESIPLETEENWQTLKSECAKQLKRHLIEIADERTFKTVEYKVQYSNIFETHGSFSHHESLHIKSSIYFNMLRHVNPMESNDIRLFQAAFNSIK